MGAAGFALMMLRGPVVGAEASVPADEKTAKTETLIQQAICEQRVLQFRYHGFSRKVEPHALGLIGETRIALLAWQSEGGSQSEPPPGWRTFITAEIEKPKLSKKKFSARPGFDPKKTKLKEITYAVAVKK
ncbi:WYL domain-containing protein [Oleiharenicola lentus]|uniref:WYL domain-containing protein n=1 Tax=Oleiharenicola lentus TaxID=2508720 RepID=UPI003F663155